MPRAEVVAAVAWQLDLIALHMRAVQRAPHSPVRPWRGRRRTRMTGADRHDQGALCSDDWVPSGAQLAEVPGGCPGGGLLLR